MFTIDNLSRVINAILVVAAIFIAALVAMLASRSDFNTKSISILEKEIVSIKDDNKEAEKAVSMQMSFQGVLNSFESKLLQQIQQLESRSDSRIEIVLERISNLETTQKNILVQRGFIQEGVPSDK